MKQARCSPIGRWMVYIGNAGSTCHLLLHLAALQEESCMNISRRLMASLTASFIVLASVVTAGFTLAGKTQQAHAATSLPSSYFAPYQDVTIGASLQSVVQTTGQKYYTLAFITGNGCNAAWAGTILL